MVAASSRVPRPRSRTPPAPSSVMERNRWWCAARSARSRSFSASRSALSGSATSARCLAALASSVAVSWSRTGRAGTPRPAPAPNRCQWGSSSTAATITAACSGETRPAASAACVAVRSPTRTGACRTVRCPSRRVVPARWVNHSAVDPQASSCLAIPRACISASTEASSAARWARTVSSSATVSTISRGVLGGPQGLVQAGEQPVRARDHPGRGGGELGGLLHDPTQPEGTDIDGPLACAYLT